MAADDPVKAPDAIKKAYGDKAVEIMSRATKIEAFRISGRAKKDDKAICGFKVEREADKLDPKFHKKAVEVLFDEGVITGRSARCFTPGVGLRFTHDKKAVEVAICFSCTNFKLQVAGEEEEPELRLSGFGGKGEGLIKLAQEAFPKDQDLQGLKN